MVNRGRRESVFLDFNWSLSVRTPRGWFGCVVGSPRKPWSWNETPNRPLSQRELECGWEVRPGGGAKFSRFCFQSPTPSSGTIWTPEGTRLGGLLLRASFPQNHSHPTLVQDRIVAGRRSLSEPASIVANLPIFYFNYKSDFAINMDGWVVSGLILILNGSLGRVKFEVNSV